MSTVCSTAVGAVVDDGNDDNNDAADDDGGGILENAGAWCKKLRM